MNFIPGNAECHTDRNRAVRTEIHHHGRHFNRGKNGGGILCGQMNITALRLNHIRTIDIGFDIGAQLVHRHHRTDTHGSRTLQADHLGGGGISDLGIYVRIRQCIQPNASCGMYISILQIGMRFCGSLRTNVRADNRIDCVK